MTTESPISILYVDTDPSVADRLDRADPRLSVRTATAAADALATLDDAPSPPVDCLVSEYDLPGTDGLGLLDAVRERRPDLPVVLYTDAGDEGIASDAIAAGVTDYVPKRRGPDRLADRLRDAVEGPRTRRSSAGADAAPDRDAQYRRFFEDAPVMYVVFRDVNGEPVVADCNDRFLDRLGYDPDAVFGRSIWDLYAQSSMPDAVEGFDRGREGTFGHQERTLIAADGNHVETLFRASPRVNADGEVIGTLGLYVDITENKRRERTLERLHDVTRSLVRAADRTEVAETVVDAVRDVLGYPRNLVRLVDDDGAELPPVAITDEAAATLGERPHYAVGEGTAGRAFADDETLVYDDVRTVDDGYDRSGVRAAMFVPIGDHGVLSVGSTEAGAFDAADVHLAEVFAANAGTALTLLDRTRELERQNERLTDFASVVSHDLRTPLSVVNGSLELARERYGDDADLARAARSLDRGFDLIEELLTLARGADTLSPEPLSLRSAAAACWESLATDDDETLVADDATIRADEAAFRRLLENLLGNCVAHGATDAGVTVTVGLLADDRGLYVADDGPGIDDDVGDDVFEVGFTTDDGGTGLGLAIVERIAQEHGWTVGLGEADGARFEIEGVDVVSA